MATKSQLTTKYRSEVSFNGYRFDELKSGLQKYIRRGNAEMASYCYLEAESFAYPELEVEPKAGRGAGLRTNLLHRLMVIYLEDIGPANLSLWSYVDSLLFGEEGIITTRGDQSKLHHSIELGVALVQELAWSEHSRQLSHVNLAIGKIEQITETTNPVVIAIRAEIEKYIGPSPVDSLRTALSNNSESSYYFARKILESDSPGKYYRSTDPMFYLLSVLSPMIETPLLELALRWAKELKVMERFLIPFLLIAWIIGKYEVGGYNRTISKLDPLVKILSTRRRIELDSFVVDMHTGRGRRAGNGRAEFAAEGSKVENECNGTDQNYKLLYERTKLEPGLLSSTVVHPLHGDEQPGAADSLEQRESDYLTFLVRAQLNTTASKPDTYFAERDGKRLFVKGPYKNRAAAELPMKVVQLKHWFGLPAIELTLVMLQPDLFPEEPLGLRTKLERNVSYPFLVSESLVTEQPIPVKKKGSKVWPETEIVDWSEVRSVTESDITVELIRQLLFRWVFGIPDCSMRNFLLVAGDSSDPILYSIDEEGIDRPTDLVVRFRRKLLTITDAIDKFDFVTEMKNWLNIMKKREKEFMQLFGIESTNIIVRLKRLSSTEGIKMVFTTK